jgi:hypothetical protein
MMVWQIERPRPVPWGLVVKKGLKSLLSTPGGIPVPVSLILTCW